MNNDKAKAEILDKCSQSVECLARGKVLDLVGTLDAAQTSPETETLKPCPFCGCDKIVIFYDHPNSVGEFLAGYYVSHPVWKEHPDTWGCHLSFGGKFETEKEAADAWNSRFDHAPCPDLSIRKAVIEECAKIIDVEAAFYEGERKRIASLVESADSPYRDELCSVSAKRSALENSAALIRALSDTSTDRTCK